MSTSDTALRDIAQNSNAWPFVEARNLIKRLDKMGKPADEPVIFETGYGPSGLPHIGTFGEVGRTTMVRRAFEVISDIPPKLLCFSDDMDGMRKIPGNVPDPAALEPYMQRPLSGAGPVRQPRIIRRSHERAVEQLSRHFWVRIRIRQCDRVLQDRQDG